jgi:hypothetical protein
MVAAPRLRRRENTFKPSLDREKFPALLKSAAIYGPNASGKSNLVAAMGTVRVIAALPPQATPGKLPVEPFRFDPALAALPSRFEFNFIRQLQRYEFKLAVTQDRIEEESLSVFPNGKEALLYARRHVAGRDEYQFGNQLEGSSNLHETWSKLTGPSRLFLSQAVANSSEDLQQLRIPLGWLTRSLGVLYQAHMGPYAEAVQDLVRGQPALVGELTSFIRDLDIPVTNVKFDSSTPDLQSLLEDSESSDASQRKAAAARAKTIFTHTTALGEALFDFDDESTGTQNLVGFFMPWALLLAKDEPTLRTLVIDEFDSSLHPQIVAELVGRHLKNEANGQLIFTTHDTHLMDARLLRRDQIWLTERDANGATQLRSVHEFAGREGEDLEKRYYEGRYRGLPILRGE